MRVPYWLVAAILAVAGCVAASPPGPQQALQTSSVLDAGITGAMPVMPPMAATGQPAIGFWPPVAWPGTGGGMGMPGFGGAYELTRFDGPTSVPAGDVTLKASGGDYDGCANNYEIRSQVQSGPMEVRLSVSSRPANRQCFASGHEDTHTFAFPVRVDVAGTYAVLGQTAFGDYRKLGSLTVTAPQTSGGSFVYEFTRFDGPMSTAVGRPATISATGGTYDFCAYAFSGSARVDAQNRMVDLSWIGTPHPPDQPRCMAMAQESHSQSFDVTLPQSGIYTVRTQTSNGWRAIGSIAAS